MQLTLGDTVLADIPDDVAAQLLAMVMAPGGLASVPTLVPEEPERQTLPLGGGSRFHVSRNVHRARLSLDLALVVKGPFSAPFIPSREDGGLPYPAGYYR